MTIEQITEEFYKAIAIRGIYKELGVARTVVGKWKEPGRVPSLGIMVEVLLKLNRITITLNEPG